MPSYIISYHGGRKPSSPGEGAEHMTKWQTWVKDLGDAVVDPGTPLGPTKVVSATGVIDSTDADTMSGFNIVKADDMDTAIQMAQACPFLEFDGTLEVAEMMKM